MASRDGLKKLIDELPELEIARLVDFAQFLRQKAAHRAIAAGKAALDAAPFDDEPDSEGERDESRKSWESYQLQGGVRFEDLRDELAL
jgi:hypothetical protein